MGQAFSCNVETLSVTKTKENSGTYEYINNKNAFNTSHDLLYFRVIYLYNYGTFEAVLWLRFINAGFSPRILAFNAGQIRAKILLDKFLPQSLFRFFPTHHHSAILPYSYTSSLGRMR